MKKTKRRALYIIAALLGALFVLSCLVGFAACGGGSNEEGGEATVSSVSISTSEMSLKMGESEKGTLTATVTMSDGTTSTSETVSWTSSNSSVATVTETGYTASVTALQAGETKITASVGTVTSAECTVTVAEADPATVKDVTISGTLALAYGDETGNTLTANVTMSDGSDYEGDYEWTSSDTEEKVVKVSGSGASVTVTPVFCGTAEITVSVGEGDNVKTGTCTVTVSEDHTAAEAGRITGSADVAENYHFMFDATYNEGTTVVFDDSSVSAEYDAENKTYTLNGISGVMDETQGPVFSSIGTHVGCEYVGFIVNVNEGETVKVEAYSSTGADATPDKTFTFTSSTEDTSFLVDIADHDNDGVCTWYNVLTVTYAGGDVETYYVVLGEIFTPASTAADLEAVFKSGGEVALTEDITLTSGSLTIGSDTGEEIEVELDLNGNDLSSSNTSTGKANSTIYVKAGATVTIIDNSEDGTGEVDASANNTAALYSDGGTVIIAGGTFERTSENGMEESQVENQNSYYTVVNDGGDMTIEEGAVIFNAGDYSTCLKSSGTELNNPATLTINGGLIYGGKYSIKNDYSGYLTMTGGTVGGLRSEDDTLPYRALQNWDNAVITGGTLKGGNGGAIDSNDTTVDGAEAEGVVIYNNTNGQSAEGARHDHDRLGDNEVGTLTIGDENGNGPEIIYEGINPKAAVADDGQNDGYGYGYDAVYYDDPSEELSDETTASFATGIAIDSGTVNFKAGTIECTDEDEDRDYTFIGVYLTSGETEVDSDTEPAEKVTVILAGALNVSGGSISGDEAIVINGENVKAEITGGTLSGTIVAYAVTVDEQLTNPLTFEGYADAGYTLTEEKSGDTLIRYIYSQGTATGTGE